MKEYMPEETVNTLTKHLADLANSVSLPDTVKTKRERVLNIKKHTYLLDELTRSSPTITREFFELSINI